ncbi:DUF2213 domain-containing protein [Campylobacter concisus]|uniref:DUF2213 domain-containing protein n=1 Tax=Campylobacter concisus TaxID=199 RepID=UPI000CD8605A|nr:DUF2213 domain-containing protein [Campylobacter concisus]
MDFKINDDGYIITKAKMASIQPMEYLGEEIGRTSGKVYKVFRDEKEVFSPETIKSFEGKPLTLTHPDDDVTAKNWKDTAIGHIQNVRREGDFLVGDAYINDEIAIKIIKEQGIKEVSCGYDSKLIERDGKIWQTNIRGNHLAVVAEGRAGKDCKLGDSKRIKMKFIDKLKGALTAAKKFKDNDEVGKEKVEEANEANNELVDLLEQALSGAEEVSTKLDETTAELEKTKTELADVKAKNVKDSDGTDENSEIAELKAKVEALEKENAELKAEIEKLKNEAATTEAVTDAKANFSHVKLSDAKNARGVYEAVILDSKAFEASELKKLSDSEIHALYLGLKAAKRTKDNSGSVLDKFYDAKPNKIDLNKKFGGK